MKLLTLAQAAKRVRRRRSTILRWVRRGQLRIVCTGPTHLMMFRESDLLDAERLIVQHTRGAGVRKSDSGRDASRQSGAAVVDARHGSSELLTDAAEQLALVLDHIDEGEVELPADSTEALADAKIVLERLAEAAQPA